ncbi:hypothetical protein KJ975_04355 [Myxococcota bacterium]|nr:hypothetical protein [Myxococcota bacterium]
MMSNYLILTTLFSWMTTTTPCQDPPVQTPAPCVTIVVTCGAGSVSGTPGACDTNRDPVRDPAVPPSVVTLPDTPPEILLSRKRETPVAPPLDAGATELALFTTARTLPRGASLVETSFLAVPEGLPEAWVDLVGVKIGLTDRAQLGFRTSLRLMSSIQDDPLGLFAAGLIGLNFKYQLWRKGEQSLAFNYVFPYTELVWSRHTRDGSYTLAVGTSLITLAESLAGEHHRDAFLRAGVVRRLSRTVRLVAETGAFHYFTDPESAVFGSAGLRFIGDHAYLDAFAGLAGEPGDDGGVFLGMALGWQH